MNLHDILTGPFEIKKQFEALGEVFLEDGRILSLEPEPTVTVYDRIYLKIETLIISLKLLKKTTCQSMKQLE